MRRVAAPILALALMALVGTGAASAATPTITEFSRGITPGATAQGIAMGPDGNMWFTEFDADKIGRITPGGVVTEFPLPAGSQPFDVVAGHEGEMWFSEFRAGAIGRIAMDGTLLPAIPLTAGAGPTGLAMDANGTVWVAEPGIGELARYNATFGIPLSESRAGITSSPWGVATGPDFAIWFTEIGADQLGRHGSMDAGSSERSAPRGQGIAAGSDGAIWFAAPNQNGYARFVVGRTGTGSFGLPHASSFPVDVAAGPDGHMWLTENDGDRIARLRDGDPIDEFSTGISPRGAPYGIAAGPDGAMWFTESGTTGRIGRITTGEDPFPFTAPTPVRPPSLNGAATPYPSAIQVSGLSGTVKRVRVRLNGLFAQRPDSLAALLVDPGGRAVLLFNEPGGNADASGAVLEFADDGVSLGQVVSGTYVPDRGRTLFSPFPAPAPAGPYSTSLSTFNGGEPNGQWRLYLTRTLGFGVGAGDALAGGWSLDVQTAPPQTIVVPGPTQTVTVAAPGSGPIDVRAARVTLAGAPRTIARAKLLRGFSLRLTPDEPASFDVSLTGTTKKATLASARVLLFETTLGSAAGTRTVKVKPAKAAVGRPRKSFKVTLRVVATDRGGNRTRVARTITVRPDKKLRTRRPRR